MRKNGIITVLVLMLVSFCYTSIYSQEEKRNRLFDFSIDITHNKGWLIQNLSYEIYPNIGIKLYKRKDYELHAKIGYGLLALFGNPELMSYQASFESYYHIGKHSIVSGLGLLKIKKFGAYVPFIPNRNRFAKVYYPIPLGINCLQIEYIANSLRSSIFVDIAILLISKILL